MGANPLATNVFMMNPEEGSGFIDPVLNRESLETAREGPLLKSEREKIPAI
jgi:hypothetical protein